MALTRASAEAIASALAEPHVDPARMRANLDLRGGIAMAEGLSTALVPHVSRTEAMKHVERLTREAEHGRRPLREVAASDPEVSRLLSAADIDRALNPENFLGSAGLFVERVLRQWAM